MAQNGEIVENFHGVYLLYCLNERFKGRTYIGYTVDPNRRLKQHNKGTKAGGAYRTSNRGPWEMVLVIYGFPTDVTALRFEWAWQHPALSRRLRHLPPKKAKEKVYDYRIRLLSEMLCVGPWNRLPLVIRWLNQDFMRDLTDIKPHPKHMIVSFGPVVSKKVKKPEDSCSNENVSCDLCFQPLKSKFLTCLDRECNSKSHIICLSKYFLDPGEYVPIEGNCPKCDLKVLWGDLVKKYKGCFNNSNVMTNCDNANNFHSDSE